MPKRLNWECFPFEFLKDIAYNDNVPEGYVKPMYEYEEAYELAPKMDYIFNAWGLRKFIEAYRNSIECYFLPEDQHLRNVCDKLQAMNYADIKVSEDKADMLARLRRKNLTEAIFEVYKNEFLKTGLMLEDDISIFTEPLSINLELMQGKDVPLFGFQQEAVEKLKDFYIKNDNRAGLLVMPTGAGKTRTSIYYLLREMVSRGYQILWLTHRDMLIEQTAETFFKLSPLTLLENKNMEVLKMLCISGKFSSCSGMEISDNIIVASVPSLCRNTDRLSGVLKDKVMVVVDEAHHTYAPSYQRILKRVRALRPASKLLGLTATPVRTKEDSKETYALRKLFDNNIIFSIAMSKLVSQKILAKPEYIPIQTNFDIETIITLDEAKFMKRWKEMPESLLDKVAKTNERNSVIVDEYVQNKEKYGKTILFALNAIHCIALKDEFVSRGIRCDFVYSLKKDNDIIIDRFRHNDRPDGIDLLININILSEGSDIPDIQTVFLTRPTNSDVALMQMVGRGMRGIDCGGTETVNVVDFCDKWKDIHKWFNPKYLFQDVDTEVKTIEVEAYKPELVPFEEIRDLIKGIKYKGLQVLNKSYMLPVGWFDVTDNEGCDIKVLVFENQQENYEEMASDFELDEANLPLTVSDAMVKYFRSFGIQPTDYELESIITTAHLDHKFPQLQLFTWWDKIEPYMIAQHIKDTNPRLSDIQNHIEEVCRNNEELITRVYGSVDYYQTRIHDYLLYANGVKPLGTAIETCEKKLYKLRDKPFGDRLEVILDEVMEEYSQYLLDDFVRPQIYWSKKPVKGRFAEYDTQKDIIIVNSLLDSESVPREVIKYLVYHECLHQEFKDGHPREFRDKEHEYPAFQDLDHYLDYTFRDFYRNVAM